MSKRAFGEPPEGEPAAKRLCSVAEDAYAESGLLRIIETSGLNSEFLALLDPISQRALCCVCADARYSLITCTALPQAWPEAFQPSVVRPLPYWNRHILLALYYDHIGRFRGIYLYARPEFVQATLNVVDCALWMRAYACVDWLVRRLSPADFFDINFAYANAEMLRVLRAATATAYNADIYAHLLLAEECNDLQRTADLVEPLSCVTPSYIQGFPVANSILHTRDTNHFDYIKMQLR